MTDSQDLSLIALPNPPLRLPLRLGNGQSLTRRYRFSRMQYVELCRFSNPAEAEPFLRLRGTELEIEFVAEVWTSHFQILLAQFPIALRKAGLPEAEPYLLLSWQQDEPTLQELISTPLSTAQSRGLAMLCPCRIETLKQP